MSELHQCPECCGTGRHEPFKVGPFSPCKVCNGEGWGPSWKRAMWREERRERLATASKEKGR